MSGFKWGLRDWLLLAVGGAPLLVGLYFYNELPEQMARHFGPNGEPDGYSSKPGFFAIWVLLTLASTVFTKLIRKADPLKENQAKNQQAYEVTRLMTTLVLAFAFSATLAFNLGYDVDMQGWILIAVGVTFLVIGNFMPQLRFNTFIGVRTPWTMANETVWRKTHRLAGPLFMLAGLVAVFSAFLPGTVAMWTFLTAVVVAALVPTYYSYSLSRKLG